jgi:hypothetical protein
MGKLKVKLSLRFFSTEHHAMKAYWEEWRYSSTHSLTSALDGSEWSASRPGHFNFWGKSPWYPLDRRLGGPQILSGRGVEKKNSQWILELISVNNEEGYLKFREDYTIVVAELIKRAHTVSTGNPL